jgi:hypothetical protein
MRAVRSPLLLTLALLALPLVAGRTHAQVSLFVPFRRPVVQPFFSNWSYPSMSYGYPGGYGGYYGGYNGLYGGMDPYGYGATFAPYQYSLIPVAYASTGGTYIPSATYLRRNYVSATPYTEPGFVRPAAFTNDYYSSAIAEEFGSVRAASNFNGERRGRPAYYDTYPVFPPFYYGPYCW